MRADTALVTGRDRIIKALNLEQPDRVPLWIHAINETSISNIAKVLFDNVPEAKPLVLMNREEMAALFTTALKLHVHLGIDGITTMEVDSGTLQDNGLYKNSWGCVMKLNPHGLPFLVEPPIKNREDVAHYTPPVLSPETLLLLNASVQATKGKLAQFFILRGTFVRNTRLRGMEQFLMDCMDDPVFVHELSNMTVEFNLNLIDTAMDMGAEIIVIEDDVADKNSTLLSPHLYAELIAPYNKRLVERVHSLGGHSVFHSDGNLWGIMDQIIDTGYHGLNPLEPGAGMDLGKMKTRHGDSLCLLGNIDCGQLLCNGTREDVDTAVLEAIQAAAPGGGYILCSSNSIHPGVKPENFITMVESANKYGKDYSEAKTT